MLSALYNVMWKKSLYKCHLHSSLNYCSGIFFKSLNCLYEVVHTNFSANFWTFAIIDRHFAKTVVPPSDKKENYVVHLKE